VLAVNMWRFVIGLLPAGVADGDGVGAAVGVGDAVGCAEGEGSGTGAAQAARVNAKGTISRCRTAY